MDMPTPRMHDDELLIDENLVRGLVAAQFPDWANLPLAVLTPSGTDNAMFSLGSDKVVRLPRTERTVANLTKECLWLPRLAKHLPIPIPVPISIGVPTDVYQLPWCVCERLPGLNLSIGRLDDLQQAARDMGEFVSALRQIDTADGPICKRGMPLMTRDTETRAAIAATQTNFDPARATHIWEKALSAPNWTAAPLWIHGDLHSGNLLAEAGRISAVIDFGSAGIGDPAADLMIAWTLLDASAREVFRSIVLPDDDSWTRGRGWALTMGIVAYPYYKATNPTFAAIAKQTVDEVLADETI